MPIKIPDNLPARAWLEREGVLVMGEGTAIRQDIRPLSIALLNLMPTKEQTELQLSRLIGNTPLQVELTLLSTSTYKATHVDPKHMIAFYHEWKDVAEQRFDGLIITGAPVERMPFEAVNYWDELCTILEWSQSHVHETFSICWGAQAALYHFHHIPKHDLKSKSLGVYQHKILNPTHDLVRGLDDSVSMPVSRYTEVRLDDVQPLAQQGHLEILATSAEVGLCLLHSAPLRHTFMFNHLEYDDTTLRDEYLRDRKAGLATGIPVGYFPEDNPDNTPTNRWRASAHLLFANWLNVVYQTTPYDKNAIGGGVQRMNTINGGGTTCG